MACFTFQLPINKAAVNFLACSLRNVSTSCALRGKKLPESAYPKNLLSDRFGASEQPVNGVIYDKKPFRLTLEAGKKYAWCLCGNSKSQPFCDGTHKLDALKIKLRPVFFKVEETKEYWLCNCKQTQHRPFCDGTHKRDDIQAAVRS